jgi:hypothetical protein
MDGMNTTEKQSRKLSLRDNLVKFGLFFGVVGMWNAVRCAAQPSPDPPSIVDEKNSLSATIASALERLRNGTLDERQAAEKQILEAGTRALIFLPVVPSSESGEFREALIRIRDAIQSRAVDEYSRPSIITLKGAFSAADILLDIMDQSDNLITIEELPTEKTEVDFKDTPFWEAIDLILDKFGLVIESTSTDGSMKLAKSEDHRPRSGIASYAGVFRLEPLRLDSTRTVLPSRLSNLGISIDVAWEPRLRPVYFYFPMNSVSAECDNGELLSAANPTAKPEFTPGESSSLEASLMLTLPSRQAKKIVRLSGELMAAIPGAPVQIQFTDLDLKQPEEQTVGKLKVVLESVSKRDEIYECKLKVTVGDAGSSMDSFRGWLLSNEAYVIDAAGKRVDNAGWNTYEMNAESFGLTYFFELAAGSKEHKLVYVAPGAVTQQTVEFELKDIPLP